MRRRGGHAHMVEPAYTNIDSGCDIPLLCVFDTGRGYAPRMARFLLEHGADTTMNVRFDTKGLGAITETPLVAAKLTFRHEQTRFEVADGEGVDGLKGVIRLLQQEKAVHANSWSSRTDTGRAMSIVRKLPAFKIRAGRSKVLLAAYVGLERECCIEIGRLALTPVALRVSPTGTTTSKTGRGVQRVRQE